MFRARLLPFPCLSFAIALSSPVSALAAPSLTITQPAPNQKIESDQVTISWSSTGISLTDYAKTPKNKSGQGHLHLWLDESNPTPANAIKVTTGTSYTFQAVKSGKHTLTVSVQNNDHSPLPSPVSRSVEFETIAPVYVDPDLPQNDFTLFLVLVSIVLIGGLWYFLSPDTETPASQKKSPHKKAGKSKK